MFYFLDEETSNLFAYVEITDQERWNEIAETEVCKTWWFYMKDIMRTNEDNSPISKELKDVFFMQ
ncbi:L-rhamnose mutarotase [Vibrio algarum]|uniref:L-rhamnose mutarotase n=1 Tax=Vibrio algarum TaxID=3020714 RepID=UPI002AC33AB2|nr:L-rhamnose mutarotase [Vibrio sp. KJ40-1]